MKPCRECGSTRSERFTVKPVFGYGSATETFPETAQCYDNVGCKRRWKAKEARELKEACARGQHPMYQGGLCVYCGEPDKEAEEAT